MKARPPGFPTRLQEALGTRKQRDFAKLLGISEQTLSRYLRGTRKPESDILDQMAKELGVTVHWFLTGEFLDGTLLTRTEEEALQICRAMSPAAQETWLNCGKFLRRGNSEDHRGLSWQMRRLLQALGDTRNGS